MPSGAVRSNTQPATKSLDSSRSTTSDSADSIVTCISLDHEPSALSPSRLARTRSPKYAATSSALHAVPSRTHDENSRLSGIAVTKIPISWGISATACSM
jgi:hypothetical protein